MNTQRSYEDNT